MMNDPTHSEATESVDPLPDTPHSEHLADALSERLDQAVTETADDNERSRA